MEEIYEAIVGAAVVVIKLMCRCATGLKLQGAVCKNNTLELSATISTDLPLTCLKWIRFGFERGLTKIVPN